MYKTVIRTIHAGATIYDPLTGALVVQNASEADLYLAETYPQSKFSLVAVNYLGEVPIPGTKLDASRFSWHFVGIPKGK